MLARIELFIPVSKQANFYRQQRPLFCSIVNLLCIKERFNKIMKQLGEVSPISITIVLAIPQSTGENVGEKWLSIYDFLNGKTQ